MKHESTHCLNDRTPRFHEQVGAHEARKLKARRARPGMWTGFASSGLIGWSVTVPTLLGGALGLWLDRHHPGKHSWTMMLLVTGLLVGCVNAWLWVARELRRIEEEERKP